MRTNQQVEGIVWRQSDGGLEFLIAKRTLERGGFWQPLTGGVEEGEQIHDALLRELFEEFGITHPLSVTPLNFRFNYLMADGRIINEEVFSIEVDPSQEILLSKEHTEYTWCTLVAAEEMLLWEDNKEAFRLVSAVIAAEKPHALYVATAILVQNGDYFLIAQRSAHDSFPHVWELPGGGIHSNETPEAAAIRELEEETGLTAITDPTLIHTVTYISERGATIHELTYRVFHANLHTDEEVTLSPDHQSFAWITLQDVPKYNLSRHSREALMKHITKSRA